MQAVQESPQEAKTRSKADVRPHLIMATPDVLLSPAWITSKCFWLVATGYICAHAITTVTLPFESLAGGPDEPMHRSIVEYLVAHATWPNYDSQELSRAANGISYATGSSFGYWLHALGVRLFGIHRLGGSILFGLIMCGLARIRERSSLAAYCGIALLTPQVIFVFCYENSDAWVVFVGAVLGYFCGTILNRPASRKNLIYLGLSAALVPSTRFHLWIPAFVLFAATLACSRSSLKNFPRRQLLLLMVTAASIASWWPVTSLLHNNFDPFGLSATAATQKMFGTQALKPYPLSEFPWAQFIRSSAKSFYAVWGWMSVELTSTEYFAALAFGVALLGLAIWRAPRRLLVLSVVLVLISIGLMLVYSIGYDYQPQGRYLFCGFAPVAGLCVAKLQEVQRNGERWTPFASTLALCLCCLATLNLYSVSALMHSIGLFSPVQHISVVRQAAVYPAGNLNTAIDSSFEDASGSRLDGFKGAGERLRIQGWSYPYDDSEKKGGSLRTTVILGGEKSVLRLGTVPLSRPDVAAACPGAAKYEGLGFATLKSETELVPPGKYKIWIETAYRAGTDVSYSGTEIDVGTRYAVP